MGRVSGGSNTPHWIRNDIYDFLRAMSMKIVVENGKICNKTMMGEMLWLCCCGCGLSRAD